jgi:hypothetical protein
MDNLRALSYYYGQMADRQKPDFTGLFKIRTKRHDQRLLPHVQPGDGPTDDHALDLRRALEDREARGGGGSFRR